MKQYTFSADHADKGFITFSQYWSDTSGNEVFNLLLSFSIH